MNEINNVNNIDLNLLKIFRVIYAEKHITRAAEKLGMTQSAVSHALQRLRHSLNDPLFIRTKNGVDPTSRAIELATPLQEALDQIYQTVSHPPHFDPLTSTRTIHYGLPDHAVAQYAPLMLERFSRLAPNMSLRLYNERPSVLFEMLESDKLDMAAYKHGELPPRFKSCNILNSKHVVIAAKNHPFIRNSLNMGDYIKAHHVKYSTDDNPMSYVDELLKVMNIERHVALTVASHIATPIIVANSNLIATITTELVEPFLEHYDIQVLDVPFDVPDVKIDLFWHQKQDKDPANIWMRDLTIELTKPT